MWLTLVHTQPWQFAAILAICATVLNGLSSVQLRVKKDCRYAVSALILAEITEMLCVPGLSPALVTCISGFSMIIVVNYYDPENLNQYTKCAAIAITCSVLITAVDIHVNGKVQPQKPNKIAEIVFWTTTACISITTAFFTRYPGSCVGRVMLMAGAGVQGVLSITLVYSIMLTGNIFLIPLLVLNAGFEMFIMMSSLKVNEIYRHLPISYAVWQIGVWLSAPAVQSVTYHGSYISFVAILIATFGALVILASPTKELK